MSHEREVRNKIDTLNLILGQTGLTGEIVDLNENLKNFTKSNKKSSFWMMWLTFALVFVGVAQVFVMVFDIIFQILLK